MGKEAVRNQLHVFLDDVTQYALEDFNLLNVVHLGWLPFAGLQNRFWKFVLRPLILQELNVIKITLQNEFNVILDLAEAMNEGDPNPEDYYDRFLEHDFFYQNYDGPHEDEFQDLLENRLEEVAEDLAPLLDADSDDFWGALVETHEREGAKEMLTYHFRFTEKVVDRFGEGLELKFKLMPLVVFDYTTEAIRVLPDAEGYLREQMLETIDEEYEKRAMERKESLEKENQELRERVQQLEQRNQELEDKLNSVKQKMKEHAEGPRSDEGVSQEPDRTLGDEEEEEEDIPLDVEEAEDEFGIDASEEDDD